MAAGEGKEAVGFEDIGARRKGDELRIVEQVSLEHGRFCGDCGCC